MKRIIGLFLIVFACIASLSASASEDLYVKNCEGLLIKLGILEDREDLDYSQNVTRAEFAKLVSKLNNLDGTGTNVYFSDVTEENEYYGYIADLVELGFIDGYSGKFRPDEAITYNEASKLLIATLGYSEYAKLNGGYPNGYISLMTVFDIKIGAGNENISYDKAIELIYEILQCYTYEASASGFSVEYEESDETLLKRVFGIEFSEGTVKASHFGNTEDVEILREKNVKVDDEVFSVSIDFNEEAYLGEYVKYFYTEDDEEIVFMSVEDKKEENLVINIADFEKYSDNAVYYIENGKEKREVLGNHTLIYNGLPLTFDVKATLESLNKGQIVLKDSDNDSDFDCVFINDYQNFYVSAKAQNGEKLYNALSGIKELDFNKFESIFITKEGNNLTIEDLNSDMSLSVAMSKNGEVVKIIVNTDSVEGCVVGISDEYVTIGDTEYRVDKGFSEEFFGKIAIGADAAFMLDTFENIVYTKSESFRWALAYVIGNIYDSDNDSLKLRILTEDNDLVVLSFAKTVTIDGKTLKLPEEMKKALSEIPDNLIQYVKNNDGEILKIDTAKNIGNEDEKHSLIPVFDEVKQGSLPENITKYRGKAFFNDNTVTFYIPSNGDLTDCFAKKGAQIIGRGDYTTLSVYYSGEDSSCADVVVKVNDVSKNTVDSVIMVDKISRSVNNDDEVVYSIEGYRLGQNVIVYTEVDTKTDDLLLCDRGDIIVTKTNALDKIVDIERVYDASEDKLYKFKTVRNNANGVPVAWYEEALDWEINVDRYSKDINLSYGVVKKKFDSGIISLSYKPETEESERVKLSSVKCVIYDSEYDEITIGNYSDILDYESFGAEGMKIINQTKWCGTTAAFLFK